MPIKLERPATIALPDRDGRVGHALEGLYRPGTDADEGGAVIAPPHPLYGGSMDNPVVSEIAFACANAGLGSLRFNWRGVGASAGTSSGDATDAAEDYDAATDFLEATVSPPLIAAGYSFGAATALAVSGRTTIRRLILIAPPPSMIEARQLESFQGRIFIAVGEHDQFAPCDEVETLARLHADTRFVRLEETDHFFNAGPGLSTLGAELRGWLGR